MAIDRRGTGLTIRCPDCLQYVQVPGVSLAEREAEAGQSETQTANPAAFSEALGTSRKKIDQLLADLEEIRERRRYLEKVRSDNLARFDLIGKDLAIIQNAMDRIVTLLKMQPRKDGLRIVKMKTIIPDFPVQGVLRPSVQRRIIGIFIVPFDPVRRNFDRWDPKHSLGIFRPRANTSASVSNRRHYESLQER